LAVQRLENLGKGEVMDKTSRKYMPHDVCLPEQELSDEGGCWRPEDKSVQYATLVLIERHALEFKALVSMEESRRFGQMGDKHGYTSDCAGLSGNKTSTTLPRLV
jgi:hypothetical protein